MEPEYETADVAALERERDEARSLLKQAVSYLSGHPAASVRRFEQDMNRLFVEWADQT